MPPIRKLATWRETVFGELGHQAPRPIIRAVAMAVIVNPFAGQPGVEDLTTLWEAGAALGDRLMPELAAMLGGPAVSYGKAAIVGVMGEVEHGGALVHPRLGKPMRAAIGGGAAPVPSAVKVAPPGTAIDIPLGHKDDAWSFAHFDTITVTMADGPRPNEILVAMALADGGRVWNRCGAAPAR
ncbi:amino acid synthesis family protein [Falsiroseomonas ponticola]|uniref:amino acid synthesis family protein n=1 Tax=Falsiroseomonas ponticola TaxID=2786951 RepID=UPI0019336D27|nr:amino acid synthesis family protein [Roseomonas ponticola]